MTCTIACTPSSSLQPRSSVADIADRAKAAALQQQIDSKSAQQARTTCNQTAAKIGKEIAVLKARLEAVKATDESASGQESVVSQASAARQAEFDDEPDTRTAMWV
jgi:hypothetical protein